MPIVRNVYVVCTTYASGEFVAVCTSLDEAKATLNAKCNPSKKPLTIDPISTPEDCPPEILGEYHGRWVAVDADGNDWYGTIQLITLAFPS